MVEFKLSRRSTLKTGMLGGAALGLNSSQAQSQITLTPFMDPLPVPPIAQPVAPFETKADVPTTNPDRSTAYHLSGPRKVADNTVYYHVEQKQAYHKFHSQLPATSIWGYDGILPGPTLITQSGIPALVRFANHLPENDPVGIGEPITAIHRHGGFQAPEDDGYPLDTFAHGQTRDYYYPNAPELGLSENELSTLWYHDHSIDVTAVNAFRGLFGFNMNFDALDSLAGEDDLYPAAFRLPGKMVGAKRFYDVPLMIADRSFDANGQFVYNSFDHDGFIGDPRLSVNGKIQPYFDVERRKYRFRLLNCSNARMMELFLVVNGKATPIHYVIGTDVSLFEKPLANVPSLRMASAERFDIILDFSRFAPGAEVYIENRMLQINGRKPEDLIATGPRIIKFKVSSSTTLPTDNSSVPTVLRTVTESPAYLLSKVKVERTFEFGRSNGAWTINNEFFDENRVIAKPRLGVPEIWTFKSGGGWSHPIHVHLANFFVLSRDGKTPPLLERGRKDTVRIGWKEKDVKVLVQFNGYTGRYAFHCHNMEHEDVRMMGNIELQP